MSKPSEPETDKDVFYNKWQQLNNYKKLKIKDNKTTNALKEIYNNNVWNLKQLAEELEEKTRVEHINFYNAFPNNIYLLDYSKSFKINSLSVESFLKYEYIEGDNTDKTEYNYITVYNTWINNFFIKRQNETTLDWVVKDQNKILLKLMQVIF